MSDRNPVVNRAVWFDLPVADLDRAMAFYKAVLAVEVDEESFGGERFAVLEHGEGNGGCLVVRPDEVSADRGILVYLGVEGRLRDAVQQVGAQGGRVLEPPHPIGPHGFRALVLDCEGNRVALHSSVDG